MAWKPNRDEYLQHWKYIKREKKNGKWQYTYPKDGEYKKNLESNSKKNVYPEGFKPVSELESNYSTLDKILGVDDKINYKIAKSERQQASMDLAKETYSNEAPMYRDVRMKNAVERYHNAGKEYAKAKSEYMKTPIYKLDQAKTTINKAITAVSKWLKKLFK